MRTVIGALLVLGLATLTAGPIRAQGKTAEARAVWEDAYAKAGDKNPLRQMLQLKLELAGGSVPEKPKS